MSNRHGAVLHSGRAALSRDRGAAYCRIGHSRAIVHRITCVAVFLLHRNCDTRQFRRGPGLIDLFTHDSIQELDFSCCSATQPEQVPFDLHSALQSVVMVHSEIPESAFTAPLLGTERIGSGVVIGDDGMVLTIGYLITEARTVWLSTHNGRAVPGHVAGYDQTSGFGLVQPLGDLGAPVLDAAPRSGWKSAPAPSSSAMGAWRIH